MAQELDLAAVFKAVTNTLQQNQETLDQADTYNHDHGTNMVKTFKVIQKAVAAKSGESASEQLAYASQKLAGTTSGSGKMYAEGLARAATEFEGKSFNQATAGTLIDALMGMDNEEEQSDTTRAGGGLLGSLLGSLSGNQQTTQSQPSDNGTGDLIGQLLGGLGGSTQQASQPAAQNGTADLIGQLLGGLGNSTQQTPQAAPQGGDLLGSLLGGLLGGSQTAQSQPETETSGGIGDLLGSLLGGGTSQSGKTSSKDLLSLALAYFMAKQQGGSTLEAIMQALARSSQFGTSNDRIQSGALVVDTILGMLSK